MEQKWKHVKHHETFSKTRIESFVGKITEKSQKMFSLDKSSTLFQRVKQAALAIYRLLELLEKKTLVFTNENRSYEIK